METARLILSKVT